MAEPERPDLQPESDEVVREENLKGGWRFGSIPGRKDPTASRSIAKQREVANRGVSPDLDNPSPPADVGTGHIGLGPAEPEDTD